MVFSPFTSFSSYWVVAAIAAYVAAAIVHGRVIRARTLAERIGDFYHKGIARIEDRWAGSGQTGERFRDPKHVYADDLDLFGRGSLFELLSTCKTPMGESRLAQWLLSPSNVPSIIDRHNMVAELREKVDLRERIAVIGEDLRPRLDSAKLVQWAESETVLTQAAFRPIAIALALAASAAAIYYLATRMVWPLLAILIVELFIWRWLQKSAVMAVSTLFCNAEGLILFSEVLEQIENEQFAGLQLRGLSDTLKADAHPASGAIRRLARIVYWIDGRESLLGRLLDLPLLYTIQLGFAAEAWQRKYGAKARAWVDAAGEMEALLSISAYAFEHPADPFPEFADLAGDSAVFFHGTELGHPLIASSQCVRNSIRLDGDTRVVLVSGSNMSGKSTLLRTVGINTVLALAGAPIRGTSLRLSPIHLGTSIRTTDSLQEGRSAFYTEILRIKQVFELTGGQIAVLFLFDEMLEGTNSHDRRIGAEGLVRAFIERRAAGIVSTHDLALTEIAASLPGAIRNMHLQDYVENGAMRFDYKLRDGVVTKSNALDLMRLIGLDV